MNKILQFLQNVFGRQTHVDTESVQQSRFCSPKYDQTKDLCKPITNSDAVCQRGLACNGRIVPMSSGIRLEFRRRNALTGSCDLIKPEDLKEKPDSSWTPPPYDVSSRVSCDCSAPAAHIDRQPGKARSKNKNSDILRPIFYQSGTQFPPADICGCPDEQRLAIKTCGCPNGQRLAIKTSNSLKPSKTHRFKTFLKSLLRRYCCWCAECHTKIGELGKEDSLQRGSCDTSICSCLQEKYRDAIIGTSEKETLDAPTCMDTEFIMKDTRHVCTNTENKKKDVLIQAAVDDQTYNCDACCNCKCSRQPTLYYYLKDKKEDNEDCKIYTPKQINQTNYKQNKIFEYLSSGISSDPISSSSETAIKSTCYQTKTPITQGQRRSQQNHKLVQTMECRRLRNASTNTKDWWSPIVERKRRIKVEKKERAVATKMRRKKDVVDPEKNVTFESRTEIIPTYPRDHHADNVLSPYEYLLQSQKYYNELYAMKNYPPRTSTFKQRYLIGHSQTSRQSVGSRNPNRKSHKTKRLVECYSPKKQHIRKQPVYEWVQGGEIWTKARKKYNRSSSKSNSMKPLRRNRPT